MIGLAKKIYRSLTERFPVLLRFRINRMVFFNAQPLRMNLRYWTHYRRCRNGYRNEQLPADDRISGAIQQFHKNGFVILPPQNTDLVRAIEERCDQLIQANEVEITPGIEEWMIHIKYCLKNVPEIKKLIGPETAAVLQGCFRSHFKIYSATLYRIIPTEDKPNSSGLWHADDFPPGAFKYMVYLTASDRHTGALRVHPRPASRRLARAGFFDRFAAEKFTDLLSTGWHAVEGPAGTGIFFDPRIVHRATPPERGFRDVVAFTLIPSMEPWHTHISRIGENVSREYRQMIPADPARD